MNRCLTTYRDLDQRAGLADGSGSSGGLAPAGRLRQMVDWSLAGFFFTLAMVGVVLPGIPTTPFLLLMCHFLIRVSPALHTRAMAWPVVGGPLRDWHHQHGVRPRVRFTACTMVSLLVGATLVLGTLPVIVKAVIVCAAAYGLYIIARLPTAKAVSI